MGVTLRATRERFDGRDRDGRACSARTVDPTRRYFWTQAEWAAYWRLIERARPR